MGVGYNWGPIQVNNGPGGGGDLLGPQTGGLVAVFAGITLAAISAPADTFAFGDTESDPFYNTSADPCCEFSGSTNSGLIDSGMFNMAYADGHAKNMNWHASATNVLVTRFIV